MPSYIAKTNEDWAAFLRQHGVINRINFWSPSARTLLKALPRNHIFFLTKTGQGSDRHVVGWGTVRRYREMRARDAWSQYRLGNGADSLESMLQRLNSVPSASETVGPLSHVGCTIVDNVLWLDEPIDSEAIGIHVAGSVVRGRSISDHEEQTLLEFHDHPHDRRR